MNTRSTEIQRIVEQTVNNYKRLDAWAPKYYAKTGLWPVTAHCAYGYKTPQQLCPNRKERK